MTQTVSEAVASFLARSGARDIFAISGAADIRLLDAIARHPDLNYVCPHHEQAGVMAASTSYRLSGCLGVMVCTAGPGATNMVTGLASAYLDSIPVLALAGQENSSFFTPPTELRGKGVQGLDMVAIVDPVTKYAVRIIDPQTLRYELEKALHLAFEGRPGPVWVEITQDIQFTPVAWEELPSFEAPVHEARPLQDEVAEFLRLCREAERPVLWAGNGIRLAGAADRFRRVLDTLRVPTLVAWNGIDLIEDDHPLLAGRAGNYGQRAANFAVQNCDFVFGLGTRMAIPQIGYVQSEFARAAKKGLVDIDPAEIAKLEPAWDLAVNADVGDFLAELERQLDDTAHGIDASSYAPWVRRVQQWRRDYPPYGPEHQVHVPERVNSYLFIDRLSDALEPEDVICTDMGTSLTCTHAVIRLKRGQRMVTSTGLGEMGFGLPGAIGACIGSGKRRTILVGADGSLMMNLQELQTVVHHQLPLKIFLLNNNGYLTIQHTERALFGERLSACGPDSGVSVPDFERVSRAFGFEHFRLTDDTKVDAFIADVLATPGPVFAEVMIPEDQMLGPKMAVKVRADGTLFSPPLEDLAPFLSREELAANMLIPLLDEE
jgi:acetolactate synthase-1/2/3 large subunit